MSLPIAYFCAEFALDPQIRIYAGGLGILAGDMIHEAGDEGIPLVGVGLYYHCGYMGEAGCYTTPDTVGLTQVLDRVGLPVIVRVPIDKTYVSACVWQYRYKGASVYLLDTKIDSNTEADQGITDHLYDQDLDVRLKQQILLGIGGVMLLEKIGIEPQIYHMNEGHSVFLTLRAKPTSHTIFTNHTITSDGNHHYDPEKVKRYISSYCEENHLKVQNIVTAGMSQDMHSFSLTRYAMNVAHSINGVSRLHSSSLQRHYTQVTVKNVTNGIHIPTWDKIGASDLIKCHRKNKLELISIIRARSGLEWSPDTLLLGWGRRFVPYKRPLAMFEYTRGLKHLLADPHYPVRIVVSGNPHPSDDISPAMIATIKKLSETSLKGLVVYLDDYDMNLAETLTAGCDVWVNTPRVGEEACGTSGMKAALNGSLALSTADGWMAEVDIEKVGWTLDDRKIGTSFMYTLGQAVIPKYYQDLAGWAAKMRVARELILTQFSATRMLTEYLAFRRSVNQT